MPAGSTSSRTSLNDVLSAEEEIFRVRGEIERLQRRLRVLQDLTSYLTVTLNISEVQPFVPA